MTPHDHGSTAAEPAHEDDHLSGHEGCSVCGLDLPFELPDDLLEAAINGKVVIFAGAGVSTESRRVYRSTLAEDAAREAGVDAAALTFPAIMSVYEDRFGRPGLLQKVRDRLEYIRTYPDLEMVATRFHRELATAYFLDQIVTTNWDTYFEDHTAATPIVIAKDYAFWDLDGRKVIKLHGSMRNLGTIIATERDYKECYRALRTGPIGGTFRHILATKRIVFVGYSFGDSDLNRILGFVRKEMADVLPRSYIVSPHGYTGKDFPPERVIKTDGAHFIRVLKQAAVNEGALIPDSAFDRVEALGDRVREAHLAVTESVDLKTTPAALHTLAYQDGVLHAVERILRLRSSGHYSRPHRALHKAQMYDQLFKGAVRKREYYDAAYIDGFANGLLALELDDEFVEQTPLYWVWGSDAPMLKAGHFKAELKRAERLHKAATAQAERLLRDARPGMTAQHAPFLDTTTYMEAGAPRRNRDVA